jgi:hypothetical protein
MMRLRTLFPAALIFRSHAYSTIILVLEPHRLLFVDWSKLTEEFNTALCIAALRGSSLFNKKTLSSFVL